MRRIPRLLAVAALAVASLGASGDRDPLRGDQYGLEVIDAPGAWDTARGEGAVIAVVDTGVHLDHPDLAGKLLRDGAGRVVGHDAVDGGAPHDENGHGTLVAGTAAAATDNGVGIAAVAPDARIMPVRVLDERGRGSMPAVDRAIRWAVDHGADVVNLSLESVVPLPGQLVSGGLDAAVRYAWERGVVVVAAAGNSGAPFTDFAASTPVLLVGATDAADRQTTYSDSGRRDMVLAPGADVVSTACDPCGADGTASYAAASGTSFAAPHVAGAVAVLLSTGRSPAEALTALRETAVGVPRPATSFQQGHGRIDLGAAVRHGAPPTRARSPEGSQAPDDPRTAPPTDPEPAPERTTERTDASASPPEPPRGGTSRDERAGGAAAEEPVPAAPPPTHLDAAGPEQLRPPAAGGGLEDGTAPPERRVPAPLVLIAGALVLVTGRVSLAVLGRRT